MENILQNILKEQHIKNAVWTKGENGNYLQVIFPLESGAHCEDTLAILNKFAIGQKYNSVVSVIPCCLYYRNDEEQEDEKKLSNAKNISAWDRFVGSVRARLIVAQVMQNVRNNATITFDFLILLLIATILSAVALVENNNVYLVSSMLISPMMGPVMASTFGLVIRDRNLQKIGVLNELISLGIATIVGFCYGFIIATFSDKYGDNDWPTYEMSSRGEIRSLWVGGFIALLCGAATVLGILGDNITSLVGVAISVSLMPPAVNAGLLWAMAAAYAFAGDNSSKSTIRTHFYSLDDIWELAALGAVSMCLTFVNIVCIYIAGVLVSKIKEVAPESRRDFVNDLKIARDYNHAIRAGKLYTHHFKQLNENESHLCHSVEMLRGEHSSGHRKRNNTWSPSCLQTRRPTVQELRNCYFNNSGGGSKKLKVRQFLVTPVYNNNGEQKLNNS